MINTLFSDPLSTLTNRVIFIINVRNYADSSAIGKYMKGYIQLLLISVLMPLLFSTASFATNKSKIIVDADTANEVDDLYAVVQALIEPSWDIVALNATQWQTSHWTSPQSMEDSHRLNQMLTGHLGLNTPTKRGGQARMYDWGDKAQHSAAAYEIISQAKKMPEGEKITVIALGALTNVASALFIEPAIAKKMRLYWLGSNYDFEQQILSINDFNCVMDIQALFEVLHSDVEMSVMPINVAVDMQFDYSVTLKKFKDKHPLTDILIDRWTTHIDGSRKSRAIWDLALVSAIIHPQFATQQKIVTSKEFGSKPITYYKSIDAIKIRNAFFDSIKKITQ